MMQRLLTLFHLGESVFFTRCTMNPFTVSTEQGLGSPKFMTLSKTKTQ